MPSGYHVEQCGSEICLCIHLTTPPHTARSAVIILEDHKPGKDG